MELKIGMDLEPRSLGSLMGFGRKGNNEDNHGDWDWGPNSSI